MVILVVSLPKEDIASLVKKLNGNPDLKAPEQRI